MKKTLMVIGGIIVGIIILFVVIFAISSSNSKKMICKSSKGTITIMYNDKTITGYTANGMSYDLDQQKKYAEQVGVDAYLTEFEIWFSNNTAGTCSR
ncbi:MAG: hypothetical protein IJR82_01250 [Bacilli bacterium]|nr:hypothetical protein [Bacilli bacterium]